MILLGTAKAILATMQADPDNTFASADLVAPFQGVLGRQALMALSRSGLTQEVAGGLVELTAAGKRYAIANVIGVPYPQVRGRVGTQRDPAFTTLR